MSAFQHKSPTDLIRGRDLSPVQTALAGMQGTGGIEVSFEHGIPRISNQTTFTAAQCGPFTPTVKRDANPLVADQLWVGNGVGGVGKRTATAPGLIQYAGKAVQLTAPNSVGLWSDAPLVDTRLLCLVLNGASTNMTVGGFYNYVFLKLTQVTTMVDWILDSKYHYPLAWVTVQEIDTQKPDGSGTQKVRRVAGMRWVSTDWFVSVPGSASPDSPVIARISGAPANGRYPVQLYHNGMHKPATGGAFVEVLNLNISETLPVDTWLTARWTTVDVIEGPYA